MKKKKENFRDCRCSRGMSRGCLCWVWNLFQSHFCFGTTIDGIKAGGKSVEKVEQLITEEIDSYVLNLAEREDGSESISGESIQIAPVFNGEVEELLNGQNGFAWVVTLFKHDNLELAKVVTFDEDALDSQIDQLNCMQASEQREPVDATVSAYTADGYSLVPADYGTTIDKNTFKKQWRIPFWFWQMSLILTRLTAM